MSNITVLPESIDSPYAIQNKENEEMFMVVCRCRHYGTNETSIGFIDFPSDNSGQSDLFYMNEDSFYKTFNIISQIMPPSVPSEPRVAEQTI